MGTESQQASGAGPVASGQGGALLELLLVGQERVGMLCPGGDPPLPLAGHLDLWL